MRITVRAPRHPMKGIQNASIRCRMCPSSSISYVSSASLRPHEMASANGALDLQWNLVTVMSITAYTASSPPSR
jgi:hypothetical protein